MTDEIKDDELDLLLEKKVAEREKQNAIPTELSIAENKMNDIIAQTSTRSDFAKKMDEVKINVLQDASLEDKEFVNTIKQNLKKASITHTEVEKDKAELEKQQVKSDSEKLTKAQQKNKHEIEEDKWLNKQKYRQYVYDGVKPIMKFVKIEEPMSITLMILFSILLIIPYFINKLWSGTIGALIFGACDNDRSKVMKGFLWTLVVIIVLALLFIGIYFFLKTQGIDILANFK